MKRSACLQNERYQNDKTSPGSAGQSKLSGSRKLAHRGSASESSAGVRAAEVKRSALRVEASQHSSAPARVSLCLPPFRQFKSGGEQCSKRKKERKQERTKWALMSRKKATVMRRTEAGEGTNYCPSGAPLASMYARARKTMMVARYTALPSHLSPVCVYALRADLPSANQCECTAQCTHRPAYSACFYDSITDERLVGQRATPNQSQLLLENSERRP